MIFNNVPSMIVLLSLSVSQLAGAEEKKAVSQSVTEEFYKITGKESERVSFEKGSTKLSDGEYSNLKALLNTNPNAEVFVLSYSDRDYPFGKDETRTASEIKLASERGKKVKAALDKLGARKVKVFNMAEKANWFERTFVTSDAQVKTESREHASVTDMDDQFYEELGVHLKASDNGQNVIVVTRR